MVFQKKVIYCLFFSIFLVNSSQSYIDRSLPTPDAVISEKNLVKKNKKPWTFFVYVAADNNLRDFASRNLKQMAGVGSNEFINIVAHVDIRLIGSKKTTRRYFIEKGKITQIEITSENTPMNSGDPNTLISASKWAFENYPADHYALILWNHGTGIIDPYGKRLLNTDELFFYNPLTQKYELDRTVSFLDLVEVINDPKGVCWDDTTGDYLTNQKLEYALHYITNTILKGQKLDILGFDACLMAMLEVALIAKDYAHIQVSSQEVELGPGWEYYTVLLPFNTAVIDAKTFASHIVQSYAAAYNKVTNDYTQSAMDLDMLHLLEENIHQVGEILMGALHTNDGGAVKNAISMSKHKNSCTHFDEVSYLDLHHLYTNLNYNLRGVKSLPQELFGLLEKGLEIIKQVAFANVCGLNLAQAKGISIYFPEKRIHPSYKKTSFSRDNKWSNFLTHYLLS